MTSTMKNTPLRFPFRLHQMLEDARQESNDDIVSWLPCGTMFKIHKHKDFANKIMPKYCRHSRYKSFLRQLSMYKFLRINDGACRGAYHHPNFQRGRFDLIEIINRKERSLGTKRGFIESKPQECSLSEKIFNMDAAIPTHFANNFERKLGNESKVEPTPVMRPTPFNALLRIENSSSLLRTESFMKQTATMVKPLLDAPDDILDGIIATFGGVGEQEAVAMEDISADFF